MSKLKGYNILDIEGFVTSLCQLVRKIHIVFRKHVSKLSQCLYMFI